MVKTKGKAEMTKKKEIDDLLKKNEEIFKMLGDMPIKRENSEQMEKKKFLKLSDDGKIQVYDDIRQDILRFIDNHWRDIKKLLDNEKFVEVVALYILAVLIERDRCCCKKTEFNQE
ncbi:MAG: hypothetical protein QW203_03485 [Thermoplasmatales archaeon]